MEKRTESWGTLLSLGKMDGFGKFRRGGHDDHLEYHSEDGPIIGKDLCSIRLCKFTARDFALRVSLCQ